jgi:hypothetical protein
MPVKVHDKLFGVRQGRVGEELVEQLVHVGNSVSIETTLRPQSSTVNTSRRLRLIFRFLVSRFGYANGGADFAARFVDTSLIKSAHCYRYVGLPYAEYEMTIRGYDFLFWR